MFSAEAKALTFLSEAGLVKIPFFQRRYVWKEENWERLLESLRSSNSSHYLGSIILKIDTTTNAAGFYSYSVIDGQQRITTLSILMRAIMDNLNTSAVKNEINGKLFCRKDTTKKYDAKVKGINNAVVKLVPGFHDNEEYTCLIENPDVAISKYPQSQLVLCYQYFIDATKNKKDAIQIYKLLTNNTVKFIVKIELEVNDNAQAIFDVSNGTGVLLTCADIIKNDLFLHLPEGDRLAIYKDSWEKVFDNSDNYEYWSTIYNTRSNIENLLFSVAQIEPFGKDRFIYDANNDTFEMLSNKYRDFFEKQKPKDLKAFVSRLIKYAKIYSNYLTVDKSHEHSEDDLIPRYMLSFSRLNACTVLFPYLLKLFEQHCDDDGGIIIGQEQHVTDELKKIERLLIRAAIAENTVFTNKKYKPSSKNFNKTVTKVIRSMNAEDLFTTEQLTTINDNSIIENGLKGIDNNTASIVLFLLNLKLVKGMGNTTNVQKYAYNYELEHIMPQEFTSYWGLPANDIDGNPLDVDLQVDYRRSFVYQIGNMTIITPKANKSIKNFDINVKMNGDQSKKTRSGVRKGYQGYNMFASEPISSDFKERIISAGYCWDEKMIAERTNSLTKEVLSMWPRQ